MKNWLVMLFLSFAAISLAACDTPQAKATPTVTASVPTRSALSSVTQTPTSTATPTIPTSTPLATTVRPSLTPMPTFTPIPPTATPPILPTPFVPQTTAELTFNLLNQQGGAMSSVAIVGQTAFVGAGPRLVAVDIANPNEPNLIGQSSVLPGLVRAVLVRDDRAYVGVGSSIIILDVTDRQSPNMLGELALAMPVVHLALHEETLVAATIDWPNGTSEVGLGTITTVNISSPDRPQVLDSVNLPWSMRSIALANETVYASNPGEETFFAIDISAPDDLPEPMPFPIASLTYSLQARGDILYVGAGFGNVMAWDISNLTAPQMLWEVEAEPNPNTGATVVNGFVLAQNHIHLNTVSYNGWLVEPFSLSLPEAVNNASADLVSTNMFVQDNQLIVAQGNLDFYNIQAEAVSGRQTSYRLPGLFPGPTDIAFVDGNGLVTSQDRVINKQNGRLSLIQLPDLSVLGYYTTETQCDLCNASLVNIGVTDDVAYTTGYDDSLRIFDLSDATQPTLIATYTSDELNVSWQGNHDFSVAAGHGYAAGYASDRAALLKFDLNDPHNVPVTAKIYWLDSSAECVVTTTDDVYVCTILFAEQITYELRHFRHIDEALTLVDSVAVASQIYDIASTGDALFLGTADGLTVISTDSATGQLTVIAQAQIAGGLRELALMDDVLLATTAEYWGNGHLLALNIQDPLTPYIIGTMPLPSGFAQLAVSDAGTILVGNYSIGLMVLETSTP